VSTGKMIRKVVGTALFAAGIAVLAWGSHVINIRRATIDPHADLYDGPWLPLEFLFLGLSVVLLHEEKPKP
jgi:hypothetical protein